MQGWRHQDFERGEAFIHFLLSFNFAAHPSRPSQQGLKSSKTLKLLFSFFFLSILQPILPWASRVAKD
jgi:hypothetical protein